MTKLELMAAVHALDEVDESTGRTVGGTLLYAAMFWALVVGACAFAWRLMRWAGGER